VSEKDTLKKLNIGCGSKQLAGFVNLDKTPPADVVFDLETCGQKNRVGDCGWSAPNRMPFEDNTFDRMLMSHCFEHIVNVMPMMEELHRIAKPGCSLVIVTPYGSSDNADEDPTHVRRVFKNTYLYFSQAAYGSADYGYRGDWKAIQRIFSVDGSLFGEDVDPVQVGMAVGQLRNVVVEFTVELRAIKPARKIGEAADEDPVTSFKMVDAMGRKLERSRIITP
jgi:SAM-dependent methyltransferase